MTDEQLREFLKEHCVELQGHECRTLRCFINGGWDPRNDNREALKDIKATCEARELMIRAGLQH